MEPSEDETPEAETERDEQESEPTAAPSGEAHQPKTDVEIKDSGSLFDL